MIELPEAYVLSFQINKFVKGKIINSVTANAFPHEKLKGKKVVESNYSSGYSCGGNVEVICEDKLLVSTPIKLHKSKNELPKKHQLLLEFSDQTYMSCTVEMRGSNGES